MRRWCRIRAWSRRRRPWRAGESAGRQPGRRPPSRRGRAAGGLPGGGGVLMAQQAQDTFVAVLGDATERFVAKGEVLPDRHELVLRDQAASRENPDRTPLFRPLDLDGAEKAKAPAKPAK